jgi:hexosaminidase
MRRLLAAGALAMATLTTGCAAGMVTSPASRYSIVPAPVSLEARQGEFALNRDTRIVLGSASDPELTGIAEMFAAPLRAASGLPLPVSSAEGAALRGAIVLQVEPRAGAPEEGYRIQVDENRVTLTSATHAGLFRGVQTLRQLLPAGESSKWTVPAVEIEDAPRFAYRGMHLDVGRHFFPVSFVKRYIDLLAFYKFNTFHWHLTEDQGWRIEIKKYPRLTEVGACRNETQLGRNRNPFIGDGTRTCGFYTQDEIRDVVAYAAKRHITIIPEIEMPGHSLAALAAYPELGCGPGPYQVGTHWGVLEDIYCPKEETFTFLENVLTEVMALFPSHYIHIGGDEAPKKAWEQSPIAQAVIKREGLKDEHELQSYFIQRMERFLNAHGRSIIGWDEILEGGLAPNATVMSWRGVSGGIAAAKQGHDVIMAPTTFVYLDYLQGPQAGEPLGIGGFLPLEKVYSYEPLPPELTPEEAKHILGAQANLWTEYIATPEHAEYMLLPRLLAVAELDWSPREKKDWDSFQARLPEQLRHLDALGYNFRVPDVKGLANDSAATSERVRIELTVAAPDAEIRYTTDGTEPTRDSPLYRAPFEIRPTADGVTVQARAFLADGKMSTVQKATYVRAPSAGAPSGR